MKSWSKMTIGGKLGVAFGIVEVLTVVLGVLAIVQLSKVNGNTVDIATNWLAFSHPTYICSGLILQVTSS